MLGFTAPRPRRLAVTLIALGLTVGGTAPASASPAPPADGDEVTTTVLPHLNPILPTSRPYDINNRGQVVGISSRRAVMWQGGEVMDLAPAEPLLPGFRVKFVNDRGQVGLDVGSHAALWHRNGLVDIDGDASFSGIAGLNDRGQALIWYDSASGAVRLWDRGRLVEVFTAEEGAYIGHADLSEGGHVVVNQNRGCDGCPTEPSSEAYLWHEGTLTPLAPLAAAAAVNRFGQVVGVVRTSDGYRAALWDDGEVTDLGTLGGAESLPVDINDRGQVVGDSVTADGARHPFLWEDGEMIDLGTLGGPETIAEMINERGQVGLQGDAPDGSSHAAVWDDGELIDLGEVQLAHDTVLNERNQVIGYRPDRTAVVWQLP